MKLRSIFASILASVALIGCVQEELPALKNIEVTPSYFTFGVEGGTKELKVTSAAAWEIKEALPEWVTVSALKGNASEKGESVTVTVAASTDTLARTAYLNFTCAGETQLVTVNQDAFVPDFPEFKGGDYWIVFEKGAALPLSSAYGYLYTAPVKEAEDGSIMGAATNIFTIKAVEGGFTIQDPAGQYYCMQGTYDSFNVYAELPEAGGVWTIKQTGKTAYEVANVANGKIMQYDPNYSSAGAYSSERGIYPNLVKVEVVPEPEPLGESMKIEEALEYKPELVVEGLVTATCTRGAILTDKSGSLLIYGLSNKVTVGDSIKVAGKLDVYNKGYQLKDPNQFEYVDSVKHEVKYPAAVELTKTSLPDMVKGDFLAQYVSVKGIVATDTYNNALIKIGDYTVKTYYSADSYADLNGKAFEITGYMISYKESAKEANLLVTNVSEELKDFVPEVEEPEDTPETPGEGTTEPETPGEGTTPGEDEGTTEPEAPKTLTLTNEEICAAMTVDETGYTDYTIESESGLWTVNAYKNTANKFLQCRGKKGAYIKTPEFSWDIKSVTIHFSELKSVYENNTYCVFPSDWEAPTEDAAYPEDGNIGKAVTDGSYSLTIPVNEGHKQVCISIVLGTYAYYLDHIDVNFE